MSYPQLQMLISVNGPMAHRVSLKTLFVLQMELFLANYHMQAKRI